MTPERAKALQHGYDRWLKHTHVRFLAGPRGIALMNTPLLWAWRRLGLRAHDRVLDVGCGSGALLGFLARRVRPAARWVGVDLSVGFLGFSTRSRPPVSIAGASAFHLPFPDRTFDVLLSSHVLHHLPASELGALFSEARRVLRPGGRSLWWAFVRDSKPSAEARIRRRLGRARPPAEIAANLFFHTREEVAYHLLRADLEPQPLDLGHFLLPPVPRFAIAGIRGSD
ncbi:MAG TPA: methyltransferase domain-containing protein [Thermoanaerobaculia bacterium]|jgi:SAM-dependent methyltransferase|nr:methyltransferase domain-containing protein [Thermoanaerobaculia bacterium]